MPLNKQFPWPIVFTFALGVIIPTACIIWFMSEAVNNERLAVRQKVSSLYQGQLNAIKHGTLEHWQHQINIIEDQIKNANLMASTTNAQTMPQSIYYQTISEGMATSLILFSKSQPLYPQQVSHNKYVKKPAIFIKAQKLEFQDEKFIEALKIYQQIQSSSNVISLQAEAIVGQARCLSKLNKPKEALQILNEHFLNETYQQATFSNGRLIRANALFHTLQVIQANSRVKHENEEFWQNMLKQNSKVLEELLSDYSQVSMPASQRRYLLEQLHKLSPSENLARLHKAEILAAQLLENLSDFPASSNSLLNTSAAEKAWQFGSKEVGFIALFDEEHIHATQQTFIQTLSLPGDLHVALKLNANTPTNNNVLAESSMDELAQGWKIQLFSRSPSPFESAAKRQVDLYIWTGLLLILAIVILMTLATLYVSKQIKSSRLKNDLIATVSHELKTPLASMRLLVDTLINTNHTYDKQTSDYLHLISKENARLTQLIENFLTFSRMERNQASFRFKKESANDIAQSALDAVKEKFSESGFILSTSLLTDDQKVRADKDMLVTALINLLENAFKYSNKEKRIHFFLTESDKSILFNIEDKGIGIARQHLKRIFNRFYRVERSVTQNTDGCGLGLSIVDFIVKSHSGVISVTSELGVGSCFSISIPKTNKSDGD